MAKYRKTALIEAEQWFPGKHVDGVEEIESGDSLTEVIGRIVTLEKANDGFDYVIPGDWIATGVKGEHWAIKPDVFAATYEIATPTNANGAVLIAQERQRQIDAEGWTPAHDDGHVSAELTNAACAYAETAALQMYGDEREPAIEIAPDCWPWYLEWWKPSSDPIRNLVKAGALIAAEIDRLQRKR